MGFTQGYDCTLPIRSLPVGGLLVCSESSAAMVLRHLSREMPEPKDSELSSAPHRRGKRRKHLAGSETQMSLSF